MSTNIHFYVERYNRKNKVWDALIPTVTTRNYKDELVTNKVDFWFYNGTHEVFSILQGEEDGFSPKFGVPDDLSADVKAIYDEDFPAEGGYTGCFGAAHTSLGRLYTYYLENKEVLDYDADWGEGGNDKKYMTNPIYGVIERVIFYLEALYGEWNWKDAMDDVRVVYWFDC